MAYKAAVTALMLLEVNHVAERLHLPVKMPITPADFIHVMVNDPQVDLFNRDPNLPGGVIETGGYYFTFQRGKLFTITNLKTNSNAVEHYLEWSEMPSVIGTNEARELAEKWLRSISIDVDALARRYPVRVYHPSTHPGGGRNKVQLPMFFVVWCDDQNNEEGDWPLIGKGVLVGIFGPTKALTGLRLDDQSFLTRTNLFLTNGAVLNQMPDPPAMPIKGTNNPLLKSPTNAAVIQSIGGFVLTPVEGSLVPG
jgi:hypothetical protein